MAVVVLSASLLMLTVDKTVPYIVLPEAAAELRPGPYRQPRIVGLQAFVLAGWCACPSP
ncbi:hypothetical protein ACFUN7_28455 [Streptomyces sp. NPDC057236]|uniref:hypothetical protein n=1 Tax=Streptomyces sp. NPDC057236 TaxID=3346059 RepID=UPI003630AAFD